MFGVIVAEEDEDEVRQKCLFLLNELVTRTEETSRRRQPHMEGGPVQCRLPLTKVSLALQAYVNRASATHSPNVFQGQKTAPLPDESCDAITPFTPSSTKLPGSPSIASTTPTDKSQDTSTAKVVRAPRPFLFQAESAQQVVGEDGQEWYVCDICQKKYHHCFSLKRHYLRSHINHRYLTERDICNFNIVVSEQLPPLDTKDSDVVFSRLYCCHRCAVLFDGKDELVEHLSIHPEDSKCSSESGDEMNPESSSKETADTSKQISHSSKIAHDLPEFPKPSTPGSSVRSPSQLECLYCDKTFSTMTMHKRHVHRIHPQQSNAHLSSSPEKNSHHKCTFCTTCVEEEATTSQDEAKSTDPLKYTCSICHKVFDDYVAMCRHHRKVHKGKRSLNSMFGGVRSPVAGSESRSQSPAPDVSRKSKQVTEETVENDTVISQNLPQSSQKTCDDASQKTNSDSVDNVCSSLHKTNVGDSQLPQNIVSDSLESVQDNDGHLPQKIVSNLSYVSESSLSSSVQKQVSEIVSNLQTVEDSSGTQKTANDSSDKCTLQVEKSSENDLTSEIRKANS